MTQRFKPTDDYELVECSKYKGVYHYSPTQPKRDERREVDEYQEIPDEDQDKPT